MNTPIFLKKYSVIDYVPIHIIIKNEYNFHILLRCILKYIRILINVIDYVNNINNHIVSAFIFQSLF